MTIGVAIVVVAVMYFIDKHSLWRRFAICLGVFAVLALLGLQPRLCQRIKDTVEHDGPTKSEILLQAIVLEARKEQTPVTMAAMRRLIARFSSEYSLDF